MRTNVASIARPAGLGIGLALLLATGVDGARAADTGTTSTPSAGALHVPSPDWRDQVIYFVMIDRFDDADPGNNDQGVDEYDPADPSHYSGGDIEGITRRQATAAFDAVFPMRSLTQKSARALPASGCVGAPTADMQ